MPASEDVVVGGSMIRYFCHTDAGGARADFCARYAEAFLAMGYRIRIIPVEVAPQSGSRWSKLRPHFATPVAGAYVNVVCAHPFWWDRLYTIGVKNVLITGEMPDAVAAMKTPSSVQMASGKRVEIVNGERIEYEIFDLHEAPDARDVAVRYDAIISPSPEVAAAWQGLVDDQRTRETDPGGSGVARDACQVVVVGLDLAERAQVLRKVLGDR